MAFDEKATAILEKIRQAGYIRIVIRPLQFQEERLSIPECDSHLRDSVVKLRGWPFPRLNQAERTTGTDYVQYTEDWKRYHEFTRLYQSGQFLHLFSLREDYEELWGGGNPDAPGTPRLFWPLSNLYTLTEVFEFASRLASKGLLVPGGLVDVSLNGMKGRKIHDPGHGFLGEYVCNEDILRFSKTFSTDEFIESSPKLARRLSAKVFHCFNWLEADGNTYIEDQKKFLEKRLT